MQYDRKKLKWNGWGWQDQHFDFEGTDHYFWVYLKSELGLTELKNTHALDYEQVSLPDSRLGPEAQQALEGILSPAQVKTDKYERLFHARGHSLKDLLQARLGQIDSAPDVVVYPRHSHEVLALLKWCKKEQWAVIPFGGGTSVVGSINPDVGDFAGVMTLDTSWMNHLIELDTVSQRATFQAGIYGPELENILNQAGFTVGHTPQSFEFSTLGGWIAARGAGSASNKYGKMEEIMVSAKLATPQGEFSTPNHPASAAGPDLNHVLAGSEGVLGVITEATVKIHPAPQTHDARGFLFQDFAQGVEAVRQLSQSGVSLAMLRLSDGPETQFLFQFKKHPGIKESLPKQLVKKFLSWKGYTEEPALMLVGLEGYDYEVKPCIKPLTQMAQAAGGFALGTKAGESWHKSRYSTPYLRDALLDKGVAVETLETATAWKNIMPLYAAVKATLEKTIQNWGVQVVVMTHISHCYRDGASLYFTFVYPMIEGREIDQYLEIKSAVCDVLVSAGGTLSHHHGIGREHAKWLKAEQGKLGLKGIKALRKALDPKGIMNPGMWV